MALLAFHLFYPSSAASAWQGYILFRAEGPQQTTEPGIRGYHHDDADRKAILSANGLPDDASAPNDAVNLDNLDDWKEFHEAVLK